MLLITYNVLLSCSGIQTYSNGKYKYAEEDKLQYPSPSSTEEVNNVDLEQCPAYLPTTCQNQSRVDDVDLEQCPAYMPTTCQNHSRVGDVDLEQCPAYRRTTCQNQSPVITDAEGDYEYIP